MTTIQEKLRLLREDKEASERYRNAINTLEDLHVFDLIREREVSLLTCRTGDTELGKDKDLVLYYRLVGYADCITDLERLLNPGPTVYAELPLDFGASDALLKQGYTQEEVSKMIGDE